MTTPRRSQASASGGATSGSNPTRSRTPVAGSDVPRRGRGPCWTRVGEGGAGQLQPDVILGLEDEARPCHGLRLVLGEPEELRRRIGGRPGQAGAEERLGVAELVSSSPASASARWSCHVSAGRTASPFSSTSTRVGVCPASPIPRRAACDAPHARDRLPRSAKVVGGILLGDAARRVARGVGRGGPALHRTVAAHEERLHRGGAEIEPEPAPAAHSAPIVSLQSR